MKAFRTLSCLILSFGIAACSNHWRESGDILSTKDMEALIAEMDQSQMMAGGSGNLAEALAVKDDPNASVYFADAFADPKVKSPLGRIPNVLGFFNFDFLGESDLGYQNISEARVFYFDAPQEDGSRLASLIIGIKRTGQDTFAYHSFVGGAKISDDSYEGTLTNGNGTTISVRSFDVDGGLANTIQLKLYASSGQYLGKISTLVGYKY